MQDFRLKVFRAVAEKLNFTQAAESLFLTQPAVTLQIKTLEEELGVKLFDRAGGKVRLTGAGEVLLEYAAKIAELYAEAEIAVGAFLGEERGKLSVGASTTIAQYVLPKLVGEFLAAHPRVEFSMLGANTDGIVRALDAGEIQLGLVEGPVSRPDLKIEKFVADEIVAVVPAAHEWAQRTAKITVSDLRAEPLIMRERGSGTRRVVEDALKKAGLKLRDLNIAIELDSTEAIKSAIEANLGLGFVSRRGLRREIELGTLAALEIEKLKIARQFQFVYPRQPRLDSIAEKFLRFCRRRSLNSADM